MVSSRFRGHERALLPRILLEHSSRIVRPPLQDAPLHVPELVVVLWVTVPHLGCIISVACQLESDIMFKNRIDVPSENAEPLLAVSGEPITDRLMFEVRSPIYPSPQQKRFL